MGSLKPLSAIAACVLAACASLSAVSQAVIPNPSWVQLFPTTSPSGRDFAAAAFDAAHGVTVLFGGFNLSAGSLGDTWTFDGKNWTQQFPAHSPSARHAAVMVYDSARGRCMLFGGTDSNFNLLGDTWIWDGADWTQLTPAHSPAARANAMMAFDSIQGQAVLFGGYVAGNYPNLNGYDTWTWDGTDWIQQFPAHNPSPRQGAAMAFDPINDQMVLFGGQDDTYSVLGDTWTWRGTASNAAVRHAGNEVPDWLEQAILNEPPISRFQAHMQPIEAQNDGYPNLAFAADQLWGGEDADGNSLNDTWSLDVGPLDTLSWTQQEPAASPTPRFGTAMVTDTARDEVVVFSGSNFDSDTWVLPLFGPMGTADVCEPGQTTPSPCSQTADVRFQFVGTPAPVNAPSPSLTASGTIAAPVVLTDGVPNQDFTDAGTGTCTTNGTSHTYNPGDTCSVKVKFAPRFAGTRHGALLLKDSSGNIIGGVTLSGTGRAPQAVFTPATILKMGSGFNKPLGIAVDAGGNVYLADSSNSLVKKVPSGCTTSACVTTLGGGFNLEYGIALDGSGDLYIADTGNDAVKEMPPDCTSSTCVVTLGGGFLHPSAVAVDSNGSVYVADSYNNAVKQMPAGCASSVCVATLAGSYSNPTGVAVDSSGNVFVADYNNNAVKEIPAACGSIACVSTLGGGFSSPSGVAVDGRGILYVADFGHSAVKKLRTNCASSACVPSLGSGFTDPYAVAVDGAGNVYVADSYNNAAKEIRRASPPSPTFAATVVGSTSTDSPRTVTVTNIGNQPLKVSGVGYPADFPEASGAATACTSTTQLASAGSCTLNIDFAPLLSSASGPSTALNESVGLTDNNLNGVGVTQNVAVKGTADYQPPVLTTPAPGSTLSGSAVTFSWTPGTFTTFQFRLGTTTGSNNIYGSGQTTKTSVTVSGLPVNGSTIHARLYYLVGSTWKSVDYTYTAL